MDDLVDAVNIFTINDAKYYKSNTVTASDAQGDITRNLETGTHSSNRNKTVTHISNGNFEQKILSNRTISVVVQAISSGIEQIISPIVMAPQTILMPVIKEVVTDVDSGSTWVNRTPQKSIRTGVNRITPGYIRNAVSVKHAPSPVIIGIVGTDPTCGLNAIQQVVTEEHFSSPGLVRQNQKLDAQ